MKTKKLVVGILAHVDAGKTTLAESMLYLSGSIRKLGRVDHGDAFLDTFELEKLRGITIFSKQAEISIGEYSVTLLDTPGHVDFSAEMERTLQVLDYAILVISGMDGVQGHVTTLWNLLKHYNIPVFIFINKMDQDGTDSSKLMQELQQQLGEGCIEFEKEYGDEFYENLAMCDESFMEKYLTTGKAEAGDIKKLIKNRRIVPCYFGSALRMKGVDRLLDGLKKYMECPKYPDEFGARVYKIFRDAAGVRLAFLKVTGGSLKVKMPLSNRSDGKEENWEEKADQIRIYSGGQYQSVNEACAGSICAVTGLSKVLAGDGLGIESSCHTPVLEPVLAYRIRLPEQCDVHDVYRKLCQLEEEEPQMHMLWEESTDEIHVQVMGEVQIEILKSMILERYGISVEFSTGSIVYKESITEAVYGVGHFEPLKHYAEVHLLLEPAPAGSGMRYETACSEDVLDRSWQRLILTHLQEKKHKGVLAGAELTDVKITLLTGRAHKKHTEGGDFRQAVYRSVRQGLKKAKNILLEPVYEFRLEIPSDKVGRALSDIQKMSGTFSPPDIKGESTVITGCAPVAKMREYQREVAAYARGEGRLFCSLKGYERCHNEEEIIAAKGYDSEADTENPTGSVFCAHGTGFLVEWDMVEQYMHIESVMKINDTGETNLPEEKLEKKSVRREAGFCDDKELEEIFVRTYGALDRKRTFGKTESLKDTKKETPAAYEKKEPVEEYLLVDGYNVLYAWDELRELAEVNMAGARDALCDILCNYQGYKKKTVIVVFDAYKVAGYQGEVQKYHNIHIVYTKEAETADQYIEKTVREIGSNYNVTVATSDALEQMIVWGGGGIRQSADGLKKEIEEVMEEMRQRYLEKQERMGNYVVKRQE